MFIGTLCETRYEKIKQHPVILYTPMLMQNPINILLILIGI